MSRSDCLVAIAVAVTIAGCGGSQESEKPPGNVLNVMAVEKTFQAPDSIAAGWVTIRFQNASTMTHFIVVERLPEGITIREQQRQAAPPFQQGMDLIIAGDMPGAMAKFGTLPEWFGKIVFIGGTGLTAPGRTSQATVNLEPGTYLLECYVKTDGQFHSYNPDTTAYGMVHQITVTAPASPVAEPQASLTLTISTERGIESSGDPVAGPNTIAVHVESQKAWENFVGSDVHLVRLTDGADLKAIAAWMDWTKPAGLQTPAPAEFLGGLNEMPAGSTGYFTVTLEPGRYAWIGEIPDPDTRGMLREFTVP